MAYLAVGDGSFKRQAPKARLQSGFQLADIDVDGLDDMLVVIGGAPGEFRLVWQRNLGDGSFAPPVAATRLASPAVALVEDVTDDGFLDYVQLSGLEEAVSVYVGDGAGGFHFTDSFAIPLSTGLPGYIAEAGDVDGDGRTDLMVSPIFGGVRLLKGRGAGHFQLVGSDILGEDFVRNLHAADFNGDGRTDLAAALGGSFDEALAVLYGSADSFVDIGHAAGSLRLEASGSTAPGGVVELSLSGLPPGTPALLFFSDELVDPFSRGGVLLPKMPVAVAMQLGVLLRARWPYATSPQFGQALNIILQAEAPGAERSNALIVVGQ